MKRDKTFNIFRDVIAVAGFLWLASCSKMDSSYREFIKEGAPVHTGKIDSLIGFSGKNRAQLNWVLLSDPLITGCKINWTNPDGTADSTELAVNMVSGVTRVEHIIEDLPEGLYDFAVSSFNELGHSSVKTNIPVRVYGDVYRSAKLNRLPEMFVLMYSGSLMTIWYAPDTVNVITEVKYTDKQDQINTVYLEPDNTQLLLPDWKEGSAIYSRSSYKPTHNSLDTFTVSGYDSIAVANLITSIQVEKSQWKEALLPNDAVVNAYGTDLSWMWNGTPGGFPQVYQTDGAYIPHTFTIDLGQAYGLVSLEQWGMDGGTANPDEFEVWGIADTTGAEVPLPSTDAGWKDESIAKGWTLLAEVKRDDDGIAGWKADMVAGSPRVRFVRIRVLHVLDGGPESHMSEISFWYRP